MVVVVVVVVVSSWNSIVVVAVRLVYGSLLLLWHSAVSSSGIPREGERERDITIALCWHQGSVVQSWVCRALCRCCGRGVGFCLGGWDRSGGIRKILERALTREVGTRSRWWCLQREGGLLYGRESTE